MPYLFMCVHEKCNTTCLQRSPFLRKDFTIKSCDESLNLVLKCVENRLGPAILEKNKMNTNTQKVEATNCSMLRSYTVHIRFIRYTSVTRTLVGRSLSFTCFALFLNHCGCAGWSAPLLFAPPDSFSHIVAHMFYEH